jgi:hypothetical protein
VFILRFSVRFPNFSDQISSDLYSLFALPKFWRGSASKGMGICKSEKLSLEKESATAHNSATIVLPLSNIEFTKEMCRNATQHRM